MLQNNLYVSAFTDIHHIQFCDKCDQVKPDIETNCGLLLFSTGSPIFMLELHFGFYNEKEIKFIIKLLF